MSRVARSILIFGVYTVAFGLLLIAFPNLYVASGLMTKWWIRKWSVVVGA